MRNVDDGWSLSFVMMMEALEAEGTTPELTEIRNLASRLQRRASHDFTKTLENHMQTFLYITHHASNISSRIKIAVERYITSSPYLLVKANECRIGPNIVP